MLMTQETINTILTNLFALLRLGAVFGALFLAYEVVGKLEWRRQGVGSAVWAKLGLTMALALLIFSWLNLILGDLGTALQPDGFRFNPTDYVRNLVELLLILATLAFIYRRFRGPGVSGEE